MNASKMKRKAARKADRKLRRQGNSRINFEAVSASPTGTRMRVICGHCHESMRDKDLSDERAGTVGICVKCGGANLFDEALNPLPLTQADIDELPSVERAFVQEVQALIIGMRYPMTTRIVGQA